MAVSGDTAVIGAHGDDDGGAERGAAYVFILNMPPVADAGAPQTVDPGATVSLDGSASSDPDGDPLTYLWQQTGGPAVALSDPTAVRPTFTAPNAGGVLTFTLTVSDSLGLVSAPDHAAVTVKAPPTPTSPPPRTAFPTISSPTASSRTPAVPAAWC